MSLQVVNWVNTRNQTLPVKYKDVKDDPAKGLHQSIIQGKIALMQNLYANANLAKATSAAVYREPDTNEIDGMLGLANGQRLDLESHKTDESAGVDNVLSNMGRYLSGQRVLFAGKKANVSAQAPAKQGLSLMA